MIVLLVCGKAESGKDTLASVAKKILEEKGKKVLITHYADLLKYICKQYLGWNGEKDEYGRKMLQYVGTEVFRERDENYWANFVMTILKTFYGYWDAVIIPDCRFKNELEIPKEYGFNVKSIRIKRDSHKNKLTKEQTSHSSETDLDEAVFDYRIDNNGTLSDLESKTREMIEEIFYE